MSNVVAMTSEELDKYEVIIEHGKQAFIQVGEALQEIKARKGYKLNYGTFQEYCTERWGFTASYARRQIKSAETVKLLPQKCANWHTLTEGQLRPITALPQDQQIAFVETHDITDMTAKEITQAVKQFDDPFDDLFEPDITPVKPIKYHEIDELSKEELVKLCKELKDQIAELTYDNKVLQEQQSALTAEIYDPFDKCEPWEEEAAI